MEDLIRRQEAIEKLCKRCQISNDGMCIEGDCIDLKLIRKVPSVEAIPVEWIRNLQDKFYEKSEWLIVAAVGAILEEWEKFNEQTDTSGHSV